MYNANTTLTYIQIMLALPSMEVFQTDWLYLP